jgi:hypothetical protein
MKFLKVLLFASIGFTPGCVSSLLAPQTQGIFDTAAESVTEGILGKDPSQLVPLETIAAALPGAFQGSITSAGLGQTVGKLGITAGASSATVLDITAALDGAIRNYTQQQGGTVETLQGAIVAQVLSVYADGMGHAIQLYEGAHALAITPLPSQASPPPAAAPVGQ